MPGLFFPDAEEGGRWIELDEDPTVLGRDPDCAIPLQDARASRRHAEVRFEGGRWVVRDLGSTNGTRMGAEFIDEAPLADGDQFCIGGTAIMFRESEPGDASGRKETVVFAAPVQDPQEPPVEEEGSMALDLREVKTELLGPQTYVGENPELEFLHFKLSLLFRLATRAARLAEHGTPSSLGAALADLAQDAVRPDRFVLLDPEGTALYRRDGDPHDGPVDPAVVERARTSGKAHLAGYEDDEGRTSPRGALVCPLVTDGTTHGYLYADNGASQRPFLPGELRMFSLLATVASVSLENVLLVRE